MNRFKAIAFNTLSLVLALAMLGFFASVGLAVLGFVMLAAALGLVAARISGFFTDADVASERPDVSAKSAEAA